MARARNIKPGFFHNEELVELPFEVRLLFIGLWTLADRAGRLEDRPKRIKMAIFPADDIDIEAGLSALAGYGFITRYVKGGCAYIAIPAWDKHQNPHHREPESQIPAPDSEADPVPKRAEPEASPRQALGEPEASPSLAVLIPDSGFLIPDSCTTVQSAQARGGDESAKVVPPEINQEAWADWEQHRRKRRKPISDRAAREQWAVLSTLTLEQQAECIAVSIRNDWQGLFPNKIGQAAGGMRARSIVHDLTDRSWATK